MPVIPYVMNIGNTETSTLEGDIKQIHMDGPEYDSTCSQACIRDAGFSYGDIEKDFEVC